MTATYAFRDQPRTPVVLQDACGPVRMLIPALLKCAGMLPWKAGGGEAQPKLRGTWPADAARLANQAALASP